MKLLRRAIAGATLLLAVPLVSCGGDSKLEAKKKGGPAAPRAVKVAVASERPLERVTEVLGSLNAFDQATLSVKVPGRLEKIPVDIGTPVRRGDVLAQMERRDYELKVQQAGALLTQARAALGLAESEDLVEVEATSAVKRAQATLAEAEKNRERLRALSVQGIVSESELETATAIREVAVNRYAEAREDIRGRVALLSQRKAELEIARQQLADVELRAPFDGVVQERRASIGEYLVTGQPVVTVVRVDTLRLHLEVPERKALGVRTGQKVRLRVEGDAKVHTGEIQRISPVITEHNRMMIVEADVKNPGTLRAGLFARAEIVVDENAPAVTVPAEALLSFAGLEKVFLALDGKAVERTVVTDRRGAGWVEITSGVKVGDSVVLAPGNLLTGQPVQIEPAEPPPTTKREGSAE